MRHPKFIHTFSDDCTQDEQFFFFFHLSREGDEGHLMMSSTQILSLNGVHGQHSMVPRRFTFEFTIIEIALFRRSCLQSSAKDSLL